MKRVSLLIFISLIACNKSETAENYLLNPQAFQEKLAASPGAILLDVRTPGEFHQEYIKGTLNFDFNAPEFHILIAGMDKTKPYFVYCASGVRSSKAAEKMRDMDFNNVYLLDGGIKAWKAAGLPTVVPAK